MRTKLTPAQRKAIVKGPVKSARHIGGSPEVKYAKWKPIKKKTAAELLERHDAGEIKLTPAQRELMEERAGDKYKPKSSKKRATVGNSRDPLARLKGETVEQYLARLKGMFE